MKFLKNLTKKQKLIFYISCSILGAFLGFLYYYFIGCNSGVCSIASNKNNMMLWGALMGLCISNIIV